MVVDVVVILIVVPVVVVVVPVVAVDVGADDDQRVATGTTDDVDRRVHVVARHDLAVVPVIVVVVRVPERSREGRR